MAQIDAITANANSFVPVIDIAPYLAGTPEGKRRVAEQLGRACREVGFYVIVGHGVDPGLVEQVETVSREFFDLPLDEKMKVHIGKVPGGGRLFGCRRHRAGLYPRSSHAARSQRNVPDRES